MTDIVDRATRSRMMSGIRGQDTKIEVVVRKALFARGFRYRKNVRSLPGSPDIVLPRYRTVVFIHGCFWHGHGCSLFRMPSSNTVSWSEKIESNRERDQRCVKELASLGWRIAEVWECALRGPTRYSTDAVADELSLWIRQKPMQARLTISGRSDRE